MTRHSARTTCSWITLGVSPMARILVVDDEPDIRRVVVIVLERAGHVVVTASDGAEAVDLHEHNEFDLIVSDLIMPVLDGIQLAKAVRSDPRCTIPILLVTASASPQDLVDAHRAGVTAHLGKPFALVDLREQVAALLAAA